MKETASTSGVKELSQQSEITYKFKSDSLQEWRKMATEHNLISKEVLKFDELNYVNQVEAELNKLNVNSFLFIDYLDQLEPFLEKDENGYLDLTEGEIANIWKCLLALTNSKKELQKSSISLELH